MQTIPIFLPREPYEQHEKTKRKLRSLLQRPFLFLTSCDLSVTMLIQNGLAWQTLWLTWILLLREMGTDLDLLTFQFSHWFDGHEFEQALGDGKGQGSLACCSSWGRKQSDTTEWLNISLLTLTCHETSNNVFEPQFSPLSNGVAKLMWMMMMVIIMRITQAVFTEH